MGLPVDPLIVMGEVQTCLLPHSSSLSYSTLSDTVTVEGLLLALVPSHSVYYKERPVPLAISPASYVGVDCRLATASLTQVRAIGTVATNTVVVGGRVLQGSAYTTVGRATGERRAHRRSWSHYLSRLGVTEIVSKGGSPDDLAAGYLVDPPLDTLDLRSISHRLLERIRADLRMDNKPPLPGAEATRLRWVATVADVAAPHVRLHLETSTVRSVRLTVTDERELAAAQRFCEDLALHDWLLTTISTVIDQANRFPMSTYDVRGRLLAPALENLAHLWMPGAHTPKPLRPLWDLLQLDPGFDREWNSSVAHVRDRIAIANVGVTTDW